MSKNSINLSHQTIKLRPVAGRSQVSVRGTPILDILVDDSSAPVVIRILDQKRFKTEVLAFEPYLLGNCRIVTPDDYDFVEFEGIRTGLA